MFRSQSQMMRLLRSFSTAFRHRQTIRNLRWREEPRWIFLLASLFGGCYLIAAPNPGAALIAGVLAIVQAVLATVHSPVDKKS